MVFGLLDDLLVLLLLLPLVAVDDDKADSLLPILSLKCLLFALVVMQSKLSGGL